MRARHGAHLTLVHERHERRVQRKIPAVVQVRRQHWVVAIARRHSIAVSPVVKRARRRQADPPIRAAFETWPFPLAGLTQRPERVASVHRRQHPRRRPSPSTKMICSVDPAQARRRRRRCHVRAAAMKIHRRVARMRPAAAAALGAAGREQQYGRGGVSRSRPSREGKRRWRWRAERPGPRRCRRPARAGGKRRRGWHHRSR